MSAKLVPTIRTSYTQAQLAEAFVKAWWELFKEFPKKESIYVLMAQNGLETGMAASMFNNNIGNVKFVPSKNPQDDTGKEYMMLRNVFEFINGKKVYFQPPHPATWFRSFKTLSDGLVDHILFLKNKRYKIAWDSVLAGDPVDFSKKLKKQGYYTAPEPQYTAGVVRIYNSLMKKQYVEKAIDNLKLELKVTAVTAVSDNKPVTTNTVVDLEKTNKSPEVTSSQPATSEVINELMNMDYKDMSAQDNTHKEDEPFKAQGFWSWFIDSILRIFGKR